MTVPQSTTITRNSWMQPAQPEPIPLNHIMVA
jgi:hypothetical protein